MSPGGLSVKSDKRILIAKIVVAIDALYDVWCEGVGDDPTPSLQTNPDTIPRLTQRDGACLHWECERL